MVRFFVLAGMGNLFALENCGGVQRSSSRMTGRKLSRCYWASSLSRFAM
jgi:hypothetical protein